MNLCLLIVASLTFAQLSSGALQNSWDLSGAKSTWGSDVTKLHNSYRAAENKGIPNLVWDATLAKGAQTWANRCVFEHSTSDYGENIAANSVYQIQTGVAKRAATDAEVQAGLKKAVDNWSAEKKFYTYATNGCSGVCGHYTQVVWAKSTKVGCGVAQCDSVLPGFSGLFVVCNYDPAGNWDGEKPF